jgi:hypothetical protein
MRAVSSPTAPLGHWLPPALARQCLSLWSWWVLANVVGGTLSLLLWRVPTEFVGGDIGLLLGFLPLSFGQWLALRRYLPPAGWSILATLEYKAGWVLASAMGVVLGSYLQSVAAVGLLTAAVVPSQDLNVLGVLVDAEHFWVRAVGFFALWGVVGAAQWLVLRRHTDYASFWIPASGLAGAASGTLALVIDTAMPFGGLLLAYIARWTVYGAMTGIALVLLLQDPVRHRLERRLEYMRRQKERTAG